MPQLFKSKVPLLLWPARPSFFIVLKNRTHKLWVFQLDNGVMDGAEQNIFLMQQAGFEPPEVFVMRRPYF